MPNVAVQMRRVRWLKYVQRRYRLIWLSDIADWLAREPNGIDRNDSRRAQAIEDLKKSVLRGEFGELGKRSIVWLPRPPMDDLLGGYCLRLSPGQAVTIGAVPDLAVPPTLASAWFTRWEKPVPRWISERIEPTPQAAEAAQKNRGGRPVKWDWLAFDRELVRMAHTPDGLPERPMLMRQMLDWCSRTWGDAPAESVVRDRISKLYPG